MKRLVSLVLIFILVFALTVPAFAAQPYSVSSVRYGLYEDRFVFEGVVYSSSYYDNLDEPSFMYSDGSSLFIFSRLASASPYVTFDAQGVLCYYDSAFYDMLTYTINDDGTLTFVKTSHAKKFEPGLNDFDSFRKRILVSRHDIGFGEGQGSGNFCDAFPVVYYDVDSPISDSFSDQDYFALIAVLLFAVVLLLALFVFVR